MSRWCDRSIHDAGHSDVASGPLEGRVTVWNSRRGNHLGQRSWASASTGRTYGRKRSDQNTAQPLARRGPSTYGYILGRQEKCAFLTKPPMLAHHIAVVENTHDPVTYMATFLETFPKKSRIFRLLE